MGTMAALTLASPTLTHAGDPRQGEQWAVAPGSILDLPDAWQLTRGAGVTVAIIDSGARVEHPDLAPKHLDELR